MIDFRVSSRQSGKSTEILNRFLRTGGVILSPFSYNVSRYRGLIPENRYIKINTRIRELVFTSIEYIYFDDFFNQDKINLGDIINMDLYNPKCNIIIRGTPINYNAEMFKYFEEYLLDKYPEMMI